MDAQALEVVGKREPQISETALKIILFGILIYWGFIALTFPVTNWDSKAYNLSRLMIADQRGLWQTDAWNSVRQVMFPWTWDAVHFPFLKLGIGFALPSFAALLGILAIIYNLVSPRWGRIAALWSCLTVMAMPTIVLQATTTKNDLVGVFALGCWLYAYDRYCKTKRRGYLFLAALGLVFAAGSKTNLIPLCAICTLLMLYLLRHERSSCLFFIGAYLPLVILFGSVETYVLSYSCFHNVLGPPRFVRDFVNCDGLRGGAANLIRNFFGNLSLGIDGYGQQSGFSISLEKNCKRLLRFFHLTNAGMARHAMGELLFHKTGNSAGSDFGLLGAIAMMASPMLVLRFRSAPFLAWTAAAGILALILTSLSIGWMQWNARYLCLPFVLFGIAFSVAIFSNQGGSQAFQALVGFLVIWSAMSCPLLTQYERPADLSAVFGDRRRLEFSEQPDLRAVYERVLQMNAAEPKAIWFLVADEDSWTLPFMTLRHFHWRSAPQWSTIADSEGDYVEGRRAFRRTAPQWSAIADWRKNNLGKAAYVLVLDCAYHNELAADVVASFPARALILKISTSSPY